ncbi:unnamed protein product [Dibothriocephalus latus]|uniref:Uncharacterized protein n=1 Tax=Dibothriocephalus latus TaxID=60516 RepID=A0A3P7M1Z0_DIBLA|nr:unnamed protein product [Dibothriocephalus latus]
METSVGGEDTEVGGGGVRLKEPAEQRFPHLQKAAEQVRPTRERVRFKAIGTQLSESNASANSLKKFLARVDRILEAVEELDLLTPRVKGSSAKDKDSNVINIDDEEEEEAEEAAAVALTDASVPAEATIAPSDLAELSKDVAKLKSTGFANQVPMDRLLKLLTLLLLNVRDGANVTPTSSQDASDRHNQNSIKSRRARERDIHKSTAIVHLYYRLVEIVSSLAELVNMQRLTDSLVLALSSLGVSAFFVENVTELQLAALKLVTGIFSQYEAHRNLIVEDVIASIARLPSSKKNLRAYRLNSEESIQMFTALALLLVQSVVELPGRPTDNKAPAANADEISTAAAANNPDSSRAKPPRPDDELLVTSSYQRALRTAHSFLAVFLKKSTTRGEDDYRIIFENFVNDLLLTVNKPEWPAAEVMLSLLGSLLVQQFNNKSLDQAIRVTSVDYLGTVASTLRRDAVTSQLKEHDIDIIIKELIDGNQSDLEEEEESSETETAEAKVEVEEGKKKAKKKTEGEVEKEENKGEIKENGLAPEAKDCKLEPANEEAARKTDDGEKGDIQEPSTEVVVNLDEVKKEAVANGRRHKRKSALANSTSTSAADPVPSAPAEMDRILVLRDAMLDYLLEDEANPVALVSNPFFFL